MQEELERLESALAVALRGLSAHGTQQTPRANPEKWTIQQIVEHLLLSYRSTVRLVQVRLDRGTPTQARPSLAQRLGQLGVITLGHFPRGRQAPTPVCPDLAASPQAGEELMRGVHEQIEQMDHVLTQAQALFNGQRFASHVILGPLSADQWRKFHLVHGRHHVKQIHRIRQDYQL